MLESVRYHLSIIEGDHEKNQETINSFVTILEDSNIDVKLFPTNNVSSAGSKGDALMIGTLILVTAPTVLPTLIQFLQNWVTDKRKISIEAPNGAKIEFTPQKQYSEKEIIKLVETLNKIPVKKNK